MASNERLNEKINKEIGDRARDLCEGCPAMSEYVRAIAELVTDITPGINMDDKLSLREWLVAGRPWGNE